MISISVGRFHEYEVGPLKRDRIAMQRGATGSQIAREDDDFFLSFFFDRHFDAGRTQHMTCFDDANANAARYFRRPIVFQRTKQWFETIDILLLIEGLNGLLPLPVAATIVAFHVGLLEM